MIIGIGVDLLSIKHFEKRVQKTPALIKRIFTPKEQDLAPKNKVKKIAYYAKRFCAKEAVSKACGTGIGKILNWQDIEVFNDKSGAPFIQLSEQATRFILKRFKIKKLTCHLSLSDDEQAIAFVVLEK